MTETHLKSTLKFAYYVYPDQMLHYAESDQGMSCLHWTIPENIKSNDPFFVLRLTMDLSSI